MVGRLTAQTTESGRQGLVKTLLGQFIWRENVSSLFIFFLLTSPSAKTQSSATFELHSSNHLPNLVAMPPKTQKMVAYRRKKLAVRRPEQESPSPPPPPARKRRAATTPEARARKLQKEGLLPTPVPEVTPAPVHVSSSSSSSLPSDPMASTTHSSTDSSSPINEENIFDKVEQIVEDAAEMAEVEQRHEILWEQIMKRRNEREAQAPQVPTAVHEAQSQRVQIGAVEE